MHREPAHKKLTERRQALICRFGVCLIVVVVLCAFALQKEGYHMDEMISFEMSNAKFNPWIVPTQPQGRLAKFVQEEIDAKTVPMTLQNIWRVAIDVFRNRGESLIMQYQADVYQEPVWISAEQFRNYITVGSKDAFLYPSVYFNVKDDNHPPVHFMLLHTVSSLFWGKEFLFMGLFINILAILGCCILMMKTGRLLDERANVPGIGFYERVGMLAALLYGISAAGIATMLLIRMYATMTFFCVALCYLHIRKWVDGDFRTKNMSLIMVTVLGFLTQYFFLFYCMTIAAVTTVLLWKKDRAVTHKKISRWQRWKNSSTLAYVSRMVLAGGIGVILFPFSLGDVFASGRGVEVMDQLAGDFADFGKRLVQFGAIVLRRCLGNHSSILLSVMSLVIILGAAVFCIYVVKKKKISTDPILWMLLLPPAAYFILAARVSPYLVDRYIMPVFPFVFGAIAIFLITLFSLIPKRMQVLRIVLCGCVSCFALWNLTLYDGSYLYSGYQKQVDVAKKHPTYACICIYEGYSFYENLEEFTNYEKTLLVTPAELASRQDTDSIEQLDTVVILHK
ncbi:MAG: hypothetical protein LBM69_05880, partial [Lachnospiraceae bacterium]|nr:hypothetical protein [Lachnospiraceae bacterium]